jgi:hypothetical protein
MRGLLITALLAACVFSGCQKPIDLTKGLELVDVSTGWHDAGIVNAQNKLVPSVTFKLKNVSDRSLGTLQANVIFRRVGEETEWGASFVRISGTDGLAPGAISEPQRVNCPKGYTGAEPRQDMLANSQFVDARVQIFAKYGSTQWQRVGEYTIDRRLTNP